ncbi:hypothetical protein [Vibrio sp. qd031]|uniref:hypothetical protein n=1 Tax=Vibrio sp. qd031 TaxID=1603038 RepID=UPI000A117D53|nr:hypothetical protein [Vibrio sp. qd031]
MARYTLVFLCVASVLIGCGGSDSPTVQSTPGTTETSTFTGKLIDSAVINIDYNTETQKGVTDQSGQFKYLDGETVEFSIGNIVFQSVPAKTVLTPLDLANNRDEQSAVVSNILRLLQSLDGDGDPTNGITITGAAKEAASEYIDFSVPETVFENNSEVMALVAKVGGNNGNLVEKNDAIAHFTESLHHYGILNGPFVGTWLGQFSSNTDGLLMFTFYSDGTYVQYQTEQGPDEYNGLEWGNYKVTSTGYLYPVPGGNMLDQNDNTGLTGVVSDSDVSNTSDLDGETIKISYPTPSQITFTITDYESGQEVEVYTREFTKVENVGLTGTWFNQTTENELLSITFLDDGSYVHAEVDLDPENADNPHELNGLEWGLYTLDESNNRLTVSIPDPEFRDLNGAVGLSSFVDNTNGDELYVVVENNVLQLTVIEDGNEEILFFYRE